MPVGYLNPYPWQKLNDSLEEKFFETFMGIYLVESNFICTFVPKQSVATQRLICINHVNNKILKTLHLAKNSIIAVWFLPVIGDSGG